MRLFIVWDIVQFEEKQFGMKSDKQPLLEDCCLRFAAKSPAGVEPKKTRQNRRAADEKVPVIDY